MNFLHGTVIVILLTAQPSLAAPEDRLESREALDELRAFLRDTLERGASGGTHAAAP